MSGPRVGYVLSQFPCYDETFILREIKGLAARGVDLRIFSLRQHRQPLVQGDARPFLAVTRYAAFLFSADVLGAVARTAWRQPRLLAGALLLLLRGGIGRPGVLLKSLALLPKTLHFAELARAEEVDHLHAHWATYPASTALIISRLTGIPWSLTCHAHDIFLEPHLLAAKVEAAEFVLTCTANNKAHLETVTAAAAAKVRVSYHGLDVRRFAPDPERAANPRPVVLGVGSLLECKGFDLLVDATALLRRRGLDFEVVVAGGGPLEGKLRARAAAAGVADRVRFTGYVSQQELLPLYRGADLFVLPAVLEIHWGIPNVLIEALACGLPVITTALPSLPELVEDGVHGRVARNRDAADLAEKMAELLSDPDRRAAMGRAGRRRVEEVFDAERTIATVIEPLLATAGKRRATGGGRQDCRAAARGFKAMPPPAPARRALRRAAVELARLASPGSGRPSLRILMYHRVNPTHPGDRLTVHPDDFRRQMEHLARSGRTLLSLPAALPLLRGEAPLPDGAVVVTFDDGYADNEQYARPILDAHGIPATFFLATGFVGTGAVFPRYRGCCDQDLWLTWDDVRAMRAAGHDIGAHTVNHRELSGLADEEVRAELDGCRRDIEGAVGVVPRHFCYPRGSESERVRRLVRSAGFDSACSVYPGPNRVGADLLVLRRTEVSGRDRLDDFRRKLAGGFDGWHRLVQALQGRSASVRALSRG